MIIKDLFTWIHGALATGGVGGARWITAGAVILLIPLLMIASSALVTRGRWAPETGRKFLHVSIGLVALSFPWTLAAPPIVLGLAVLAGLWFGLVRRIAVLRSGIGAALHGVRRASFGELYFIVGVAGTFLASGGDPFRYCLPLGVLVLADTNAALVGSRAGARRHPLGNRGKTIEGSLAFFATTFGIAVAALLLAPAHVPLPVVATALVIAADATLLELASPDGTDNVVVPLGVLALLLALEHAAALTLGLHLIAATALAARWNRLRTVVQP